jgi:hypothetical protein
MAKHHIQVSVVMNYGMTTEIVIYGETPYPGKCCNELWHDYKNSHLWRDTISR